MGGIELCLKHGEVPFEVLSLLAEHAGQDVLGAKLVMLKNQQIHHEMQVLLQVKCGGGGFTGASSGRKGG